MVGDMFSFYEYKSGFYAGKNKNTYTICQTIGIHLRPVRRIPDRFLEAKHICLQKDYWYHLITPR